jgi:hypothetical protein
MSLLVKYVVEKHVIQNKIKILISEQDKEEQLFNEFGLLWFLNSETDFMWWYNLDGGLSEECHTQILSGVQLLNSIHLNISAERPRDWSVK